MKIRGYPVSDFDHRAADISVDYPRVVENYRSAHEIALRVVADQVWEFLWREVQLDGAIRRKHIVIGMQEDLPTESAAQTAVDAIRFEIL